MSSIDILLIALLLFFMSIHIASGMKMYQYSLKRGEKASFFLLRLKILSAVSKYKRSTKQESGQTGTFTKDEIDLCIGSCIGIVSGKKLENLSEKLVHYH